MHFIHNKQHVTFESYLKLVLGLELVLHEAVKMVERGTVQAVAQLEVTFRETVKVVSPREERKRPPFLPAWATLLPANSRGGGKAAASYNLSYGNLEIAFLLAVSGVEVIIVVVRHI